MRSAASCAPRTSPAGRELGAAARAAARTVARAAAKARLRRRLPRWPRRQLRLRLRRRLRWHGGRRRRRWTAPCRSGTTGRRALGRATASALRTLRSMIVRHCVCLVVWSVVIGDADGPTLGPIATLQYVPFGSTLGPIATLDVPLGTTLGPTLGPIP